jgi:nitrogen fixation NifU-like protein
MIDVRDGVVADVAFTGRGCAISQASASLLTDEMRGKPLEELDKLTPDDVLDLLGIEISPARLKCALLSLDTLSHAMHEGAVDAAPDEAAPADGTRATSGERSSSGAPPDAVALAGDSTASGRAGDPR